MVAEPICVSSTTFFQLAMASGRPLVRSRGRRGQCLLLRILVNSFAPIGVGDIGVWHHDLKAVLRYQMKSCRRARATGRDHIHTGEHLIQAFQICRFKFDLYFSVCPAAIMIVDRKPETMGSVSDILTQPPADAMAEHAGWFPIFPF